MPIIARGLTYTAYIDRSGVRSHLYRSFNQLDIKSQKNVAISLQIRTYP